MRRARSLLWPLLASALLSLGACQTAGTPGGSRFGSSGDQIITTDNPAALAREHFARSNYGLAERYFRTAVEAEPLDGPSWIGLAASYDQLGRFDLADRAYERASQLNGETVQILNNRGYSYLLRGDGKSAARMFAKARALDPANPIVANNTALLRSPR